MKYFATILALVASFSAIVLAGDSNQTLDIPYSMDACVNKWSKKFASSAANLTADGAYQDQRSSLFNLTNALTSLVQEFVALDTTMTWEQVDRSETDAKNIEGVTVASVLSDIDAGLDNIKARANSVPPEYDTLNELLELLEYMLGRFAAKLNRVFTQEPYVSNTNSWVSNFHAKIEDVKTALNHSTSTQQSTFHYIDAVKTSTSTANATSTSTSQAAASKTAATQRRREVRLRA